MIKVEVAYATLEQQTIIELEVAKTATIEQIIAASGILEKYSTIDLAKNKVGVFASLKKLDDKVNDGDRIEIYRELIIDPKQARLNRLAKRREKQG